jgi:hypothetical protein
MIKLSRKKESQQERRFRASIYVDLFVLRTENKEYDRKVALQKVEEISKGIPNSYVGGVGHFGDGLTLDQEI